MRVDRRRIGHLYRPATTTPKPPTHHSRSFLLIASMPHLMGGRVVYQYKLNLHAAIAHAGHEHNGSLLHVCPTPKTLRTHNIPTARRRIAKSQSNRACVWLYLYYVCAHTEGHTRVQHVYTCGALLKNPSKEKNEDSERAQKKSSAVSHELGFGVRSPCRRGSSINRTIHKLVNLAKK